MPLDGLEQLRPPEAPYLAETSESEPERPKHPSWNRKLNVWTIPRQSIREVVTPEEASEMIRQGQKEYQAIPEPSHALLAVAPPGTGKSYHSVRIAEDVALQQGWRVLYAGPRHEFFNDLLRMARYPELWYEWLPRQAGEDNKIETCRHADAINHWMNKGYEGKIFCRSVCKWEKACFYHAQKGTKARIIFGQHQHVWSGHPLPFQMVIGDEDPLNAFRHHWLIPAKRIIPNDMDITEPITEIIHAIHSLAIQGSTLEGPALLNAIGGTNGGAQYVLDAVEAFASVTAAIPEPPTIHSVQDAEEAPYFHIFELARLLHKEASVAVTGKDYPHRIIVNNGFLHLLLRRRVSKQMPPHMLWLDATGNQRVYETLLGRPVKVINPQVRMQGRIFQIYDRANGKGAVIDSQKDDAGNTKTTIKATVKDIKRQVAKIITNEGYRRVGIITHQAIEDEFSEYPDRGHYYGARGTNRFEGVDALILVGVPQPGINDIDKTARMLFWDRMQPFKLNDEHGAPVLPWTVIDRPFNYVAEDGMGRAYPASGFWGDADLNAVLWQMREAELIQAVHRARPNRQPVDIWLLENLPVEELPLFKLMTAREIFGAPKGVNIYRWDDLDLLAQMFEAEGLPISAQDIQEHLHVSFRMAVRYYQVLRAQPGRWQERQALYPSAAKKKAGRPRLILMPTKRLSAMPL